MLGLIDLLRSTSLDEEQRGHVAALGEAAEALLRMTEDALALALKRYGSGSTDYGQAFVDLRQL